ncbi:MAG: class I SAM-dependent methyltransferase [Actinomycetota bacterium]
MLSLDYDRWDPAAGELLLDVGCGRGRHSFEAMVRGLDVVPFDLDEIALSHTERTARDLRATGLIPKGVLGGCTRGDAHRLPFSDGVFERVIASEVLEHIEEDAAVIDEIFRVLKPGGSAVVTVPRFWPERVCWALSDEYHRVEGGHVRIYTGHELRQKLRTAGFEVTDSHHAHALHSPYWWLKCAVGVEESPRSVMLYRRFLEWDIMTKPRVTRRLERMADPVLGKSLVVYLRKPEDGP